MIWLLILVSLGLVIQTERLRLAKEDGEQFAEMALEALQDLAKVEVELALLKGEGDGDDAPSPVHGLRGDPAGPQVLLGGAGVPALR